MSGPSRSVSTPRTPKPARLRSVGLTVAAGWLEEAAVGLGGSDREGVVRRLAAVVSLLERVPDP